MELYLSPQELLSSNLSRNSSLIIEYLSRHLADDTNYHRFIFYTADILCLLNKDQQEEVFESSSFDNIFKIIYDDKNYLKARNVPVLLHKTLNLPDIRADKLLSIAVSRSLKTKDIQKEVSMVDFLYISSKSNLDLQGLTKNIYMNLLSNYFEKLTFDQLITIMKIKNSAFINILEEFIEANFILQPIESIKGLIRA